MTSYQRELQNRIREIYLAANPPPESDTPIPDLLGTTLRLLPCTRESLTAE